MKINCTNPNHEDRNASLHIYPDYSYCFSCGYSCKTEDILNADEIKKIKKNTEKEDIKETVEWIRSLPRRVVRGLELPTFQSDYFVLWPDGSYYKRRTQNPNCRYVGPRGHKSGLFDLGGGDEIVVVVEGELNCLSLHTSLGFSRIRIVSPGSTSGLQGFLEFYLKFKRVIVFVDKDAAGVSAGMKLKKTLIRHGKKVDLVALDKDFNQTLQDGGKSAVKEQFMRELGLR